MQDSNPRPSVYKTAALPTELIRPRDRHRSGRRGTSSPSRAGRLAAADRPAHYEIEGGRTLARVFLSYARDDRQKAEAIAAALEQRGHSVWWDRHLEGGSRFSQEIEQALREAEVVLVLWSQASLQSAWVQDEAAEGRDSGRLVPAVIDRSKPPLGFRQYQAIDLSGWKGRGTAAAIDSLHRAILARAGSSEPAAAPGAKRWALPELRRPTIIAIVLVLMIVAAAAYSWLAHSDRGKPEALRIQLGEISATTPDVPASLPPELRDEILNALGTDAVLIATLEPNPAATPGFALNSSVRGGRDLLTFTFHLVNERTGATVWSDSLERPVAVADMAARQVAMAVSQVLRCGLGGAARYPRTLPDDSLSLYLSFCEEYWADTAGKPMNPSRAVDFAQRLTEASPDFARGWAALAEVAAWQISGPRAISPAALQARAEAAAKKAIALDSEDSEGYQALANLQPPLAHAERERLHLKSISVRPGDCGCEYVSYGSFLNRVGRNAEAADAFRRAHDMIPLSAEVNMRWAEGLFMTGRAAEARNIVAEVLKIWPDYGFVREVRLRNALWTGAHDEAAEVLSDPMTPLSERERSALSAAVNALRTGDARAKGQAIAAIRNVGGENFDDARLPILTLAALGAEQDALSLASAILPRSKSRAIGVLYDPPLAGARRRPEFAKLAQQLGLVQYWRQSKRKPDFCKERDPAPVCAAL